MKGLVTTISALAVVAGVASAQVQSTNIVGYQDLGGNSGALVSVAPTFINVGSAGAITLADITVNEEGLEGGLMIRFFDSYGDPLDEGDYVYVQGETIYGGYADGWYLADTLSTYEFEEESCRNSKPIPAGSGFVLIPYTDGAKLIIPNPLAAN